MARENSHGREGDLPKIKNHIWYAYASFAKAFCFVFFGTGSLLLAFVLFPILRLFFHPKTRFQKIARAIISLTFRFFIKMQCVLGVMRVSVSDRAAFKKLQSKIVVANHPSIMDVVFLISLMPNADCIVRGGLKKTVVSGIITQLYIQNSLDYEQILAQAQESLKNGNNLIIFPEGTRTPRGGKAVFKKGAARIASLTKCNVMPVYIGGNDKYGLGKGDKFLSYNHTERYHYDIHLLEEIDISAYADLEPQIIARRLTSEMHSRIAQKALQVDNKLL